MASSDLARLVVKLEAQTQKYDAALKKATNELRQFSGSSKRFLDGLGGQFSALAKRVLVAGGCILSNDTIEALTITDRVVRAMSIASPEASL